jgi:hypothetical protein
MVKYIFSMTYALVGYDDRGLFINPERAKEVMIPAEEGRWDPDQGWQDLSKLRARMPGCPRIKSWRI